MRTEQQKYEYAMKNKQTDISNKLANVIQGYDGTEET